MGRVEKRIFAGGLLLLALALGSMLAERLLFQDEAPVYHISVLLDGSGEDYWQNFRMGVERAAQENGADVRILTRYEGEAGPAQAQMLQKEWEGGADGAILIPVEQDILSQTLQAAPAGLAVAVMGPAMSGVEAACTISASNWEMGRRLADAIAADGAASCTLFFSQAGSSEAERERARGMRVRLEELKIPVEQQKVDLEEEFDLPDAGALAALTPEVAAGLCLQEGSAGRIYGIGTSNRLLHYVEEGAVAALVVQSDYEAGYLCLSGVLLALEGRRASDRVLDCYTVTRQTLFSDPLEQILFPIG